jgi:hypothetical protein
MARRTSRGKIKIQLLKRQEVDFYARLWEAVNVARGVVAKKVAGTASSAKAVASAKARDDLYSKVGGVYGVLAKELDAIAREIVETGAIDWHKEALKDIKLVAGEVDKSVAKFDRERIKTYWQMIHPDQESQLAAVFTKKMTKEDIGQLRTAFVETWRQGEVEGLTLRERHAMLQDKWDAQAGNMLGDRFVDAAGRKWTNARYLDMLTRTTTQRVARDSYFDTLIANGDDLVQIENVDGEACTICQAWDGVILSIGGGNPDYPSYQMAMDAGMFHPQCRCMTDRVDEAVDADEIDKQAEQQNVDWADSEAVSEYSADFERPVLSDEDIDLSAQTEEI